MNARLESTVFQNGIISVTDTLAPKERAFGQLVRVSVPNSNWIQTLRNRLDEISSLPNGWDGYFGRAVTFTNALFAANLINRLYRKDISPPSLVPGGDGTIQIEWHEGGYDIELDIAEPYLVYASRHSIITGTMEEITLDNDFTIVSQWLDQIRRAHHN